MVCPSAPLARICTVIVACVAALTFPRIVSAQRPAYFNTGPAPISFNVPQVEPAIANNAAPVAVEGVPTNVLFDAPPAESVFPDNAVYLDDGWVWQFLPTGIIYRSYYAGVKEPRMAAVHNWANGNNRFFDGTIGGRIAMFRYGTTDPTYPEGWQIDIEAAGFPRLNIREERDLTTTDFRVGVPITYGEGPIQLKFGYYHLSSHVGDEFLVKNPTFVRPNYVRDALIFGISYYLEAVHIPAEARVYAETTYSFNTYGGAEPWEFQFGIDLVATEDGPCIWQGSPFLAVNGYLREEVNFGGNFVIQSGLLWRAAQSTSTFRFGMEYVNGKNVNFELFNTFEQRFGIGVWYDF